MENDRTTAKLASTLTISTDLMRAIRDAQEAIEDENSYEDHEHDAFCALVRVLGESLADEIGDGADVSCPSVDAKCGPALHENATDLKMVVPTYNGKWLLDDHFTNRFAAAIGLDKTGRLRQAGKPPQSSGKDVDHAKSICTCDCLGP